MAYKPKILALTEGGTNASLVASNGGIFYSTATAGAILASTSTANQPLLSGASGAPGWSTATYPGSTTANQILYSSAANVITGLASANNGTLVTSSAGVPSLLAGPGTTGQVLQSNAAAAPSFSTASYPSTTTASQLLYSSSNNVVAGLTSGNDGVLITSGAGVPSISSTIPATTQANITQTGTLGNQLNTTRCCFGAFLNGSTANDKTGDATTYTIVFNAENFDQGNNFNTGTGTFTAPVTGKYLFNVQVSLANVTVAHTSAVLYFVTTGGTYQFGDVNPGVDFDTAGLQASYSFSKIVAMSATNTAIVQAYVSGSTKTIGIAGNSQQTSFDGYLLC